MASDTAAALNDYLKDFLIRGSALKFDWCSRNCGFWVCDWIEERLGRDPVFMFRDRFQKASDFQRFVLKKGGNEAFSRMVAEGAGLHETSRPRPGDVGLVTTASGAMMAIFLGNGNWAAKSMDGVLIDTFPMITAWRI
jgi:hypothetical protein